MFQLINAIGVGHNSVTFCGGDFALRNIKHPLPPLNNLPLLTHTGYIGISGINHFASFFVVAWMFYTGLRNGVGLALVGIAYLLLIKTRGFHNLIQRLNLIIFRLITLISLIFINGFVSLYSILAIFILAVEDVGGHLF